MKYWLSAWSWFKYYSMFIHTHPFKCAQRASELPGCIRERVLDTYRDNGSFCWHKQDQSAAIRAARFCRCITRNNCKAFRTSHGSTNSTVHIISYMCTQWTKIMVWKNKHCWPASLVLQWLWKKRVPLMHLKENLWYAYWWSIVSKLAETPQIPCSAGGAPKTPTVHWLRVILRIQQHQRADIYLSLICTRAGVYSIIGQC